MSSLSARAAFVSLLLGVPVAATAGGFRLGDASCIGATSCTVQFNVGSAVSYPRVLTCQWSQTESAAVLRRFVVTHQPTGMPDRLVFAQPVEAVEATARAYNIELQPADLQTVKGGKLFVTHEWDRATNSTLRCTYVFSN